MTAAIIVLGILFLAAAGVAVWLYIKQREAQQRQLGAGISNILRGLLASGATALVAA